MPRSRAWSSRSAATRASGLPMAMGILSTLLCDAGYGSESGTMVDGPQHRPRRPVLHGAQHRRLRGRARFKQRMDGIIREYRGTRLAEGVRRVFVPGEMEDEIERRNRHGWRAAQRGDDPEPHRDRRAGRRRRRGAALRQPMPAFPIIDSHVHFYDPGRLRYGWLHGKLDGRTSWRSSMPRAARSSSPASSGSRPAPIRASTSRRRACRGVWRQPIHA